MKLDKTDDVKKPLLQGAVEIGFSEIEDVAPPEFYAIAQANAAGLLTMKAPG